MRRLSYILLFSLIAFKQKACGVCREISRHIFLFLGDCQKRRFLDEKKTIFLDKNKHNYLIINIFASDKNKIKKTKLKIKNLIARELWRNVLIDEAMRENSVTIKKNNYGLQI